MKLYGSPHSRTMRVLWMLTEVDQPFDLVPWAWNDPALKTPEFLALNPAGAVPTLVDGDLVLPESLAINLYLARRYGPALCVGPHADATAQRWSLWAQGDLEPWINRDARLSGVHAALAPLRADVLAPPLAVLERAVAGGWLAGEDFGVADLNVAGVLSPSRTRSIDLSAHPGVRDWLDRCYARPACRLARQRYAPS